MKGNRAVGVRREDGKEAFAKTIISDAGIRNTYGKLLPEATRKKHGFAKKLDNVPPSVAHISLYIGLNTTSRSLGSLKTIAGYIQAKTIMLQLITTSPTLTTIHYRSLISFPSAKDPSFQTRFPGKGTVEVVGLAPYEWFAQWEGTRWKKRGDDYEAFKAKLTKRLLEPLLDEYPQIEAHIEHMELSTPLSTKTFATSTRVRFTASSIRQNASSRTGYAHRPRLKDSISLAQISVHVASVARSLAVFSRYPLSLSETSSVPSPSARRSTTAHSIQVSMKHPTFKTHKLPQLQSK